MGMTDRNFQKFNLSLISPGRTSTVKQRYGHPSSTRLASYCWAPIPDLTQTITSVRLPNLLLPTDTSSHFLRDQEGYIMFEATEQACLMVSGGNKLGHHNPLMPLRHWFVVKERWGRSLLVSDCCLPDVYEHEDWDWDSFVPEASDSLLARAQHGSGQ